MVDYRPGSQNEAPDALSCKHDLLPLMGLPSPVFDCISELQQSYATDLQVQTLWHSFL